jgi:hypothetical protein
LASSLYESAIIAAWRIAALLFTLQAAGSNAALPALLLACGVVTFPIRQMTNAPGALEAPQPLDLLTLLLTQLAVLAMAATAVVTNFVRHVTMGRRGALKGVSPTPPQA